jgi:predicted small lipoprotein YifL
MNWCIRLTALLVMLALAGCAQAGAQYAPYSPENTGNMHDSGGGAEGR